MEWDLDPNAIWESMDLRAEIDARVRSLPPFAKDWLGENAAEFSPLSEKDLYRFVYFPLIEAVGIMRAVEFVNFSDNPDKWISAKAMERWVESGLNADERLHRIRQVVPANLSMLHNDITALDTARLAMDFSLGLARNPHK